MMMASTARWPIKTVEIMDVSLDTDNVRLRSVEPYEADTLAYLFEYEDAFELASEIVQDGFFDNDLPIVVKEDGKLIVLEGNRRISALRGLANPTCVPRYKNQLGHLRGQLSNDALEQLQSIRVMEAPDRQSVQPILASLHTRNPKKSWPLDQQAAFYSAQLGPTVSVTDLQERYPSAASRIPRFIRMAEMYDLVRKANLGEPTLKEFSESKQFKMSIYERLYASEDFRQKLGVTFENDGHIKVQGNKKDIERILSQVVRDMKTGFLDTRRLGKQGSKDFKEYLEGIGLSKASPPETNGSPGSTPTPDNQTSTSSKRRKTTTLLDTGDLAFGLSCPALERRYLELKAINVVLFPNATMDLLRTVLECALKQYLIEARDPIPSQSGNWITLGNALDHALKHFKTNSGLTTIIASLKTSKPQDEVQFYKSSVALNAVNHNPDVFFGPVEVRETWDHVRPLLKILLAGVQGSGVSP